MKKVLLMNKKVNIGNVLVDNVTMQETLDAIEGFVAKGTPCYITNPNVDIVIRYNRDDEFERYYKEGALCVADGVPILWAAKFLGTPLKEKVSGSDLVPRVCELAHAKGYKLFFLGGRPGAADAAKRKLQESLIDLKVVGTYAPPLGFEKDESELRKIALMIKEAKPDILFVGLGAPKQERWIKQYHQQLAVPVSMGVGVTFEFIAGIVKRAPKWMQKIGFEWLWRLSMEPGRLWRRYLIDDMQFFGLILKQKIGGKR
jgi:N-acetylglucosaminyldiphosphoundecaprenol N-acetyl-beta-D-mannosaminyltransferase